MYPRLSFKQHVANDVARHHFDEHLLQRCKNMLSLLVPLEAELIQASHELPVLRNHHLLQYLNHILLV